MTTLPPPLPKELTQTGGSTDVTIDELFDVITKRIAHHPRSLQKAIGPSEVGQACARRLAYQLLGHEERQSGPNWKATVGTAVHAWLERTFGDDNRRMLRDADMERWLIESRVTVGATKTLGKVSGSCDLFDRVTGLVVDWKCIGPAQLRHYKADGPSAQYRTQAHLYGRGWKLLGYDVSDVCICFLPRNGELRDAYAWHEPWDEAVALQGLERLEGIAATCNMLGDAALAMLPTADVWCINCPFFKAGSTDPRDGCPGHDMPKAADSAALGFISTNRK